MDLRKLQIGKEYTMLNPGKKDQLVKVLSVRNKECPRCGEYLVADIEYVSNDCTKGMISWVNKIECERYIRELN